MLRLHPTIHSVPDNFWHTAFVALVASFFVWQTGQNLIELFLTDGAATRVEQALLNGEGHPVQRWLGTLTFTEDGDPLLWNRVLSFTGWIFSLSLFLRTLKIRSGFLGAVPGWLVLFTLPGFSVWMSAAGSGSWGVYFFLKAYFTLTGHETQGPLIRGGVFAALAVLIHPVWILPSLGLLAGGFDAYRSRVKWPALGFVSACVAGALVWMLLSPGDGGSPLAGSDGSGPFDGDRVLLLHRYLFLVLNLLLLLVYGARRRGLGWWSLSLTLPLLFLEPFLSTGIETVLVPFWIFTALGLGKLPVLLDVRFPRAYQTVLLCQLLLWLPVYLGSRVYILYPLLP